MPFLQRIQAETAFAVVIFLILWRWGLCGFWSEWKTCQISPALFTTQPSELTPSGPCFSVWFLVHVPCKTLGKAHQENLEKNIYFCWSFSVVEEVLLERGKVCWYLVPSGISRSAWKLTWCSSLCYSLNEWIKATVCSHLVSLKWNHDWRGLYLQSWILKFYVSSKMSCYLEMSRKSAFVCSHHFGLGQVYVVKQVNHVFQANHMFWTLENVLNLKNTKATCIIMPSIWKQSRQSIALFYLKWNLVTALRMSGLDSCVLNCFLVVKMLVLTRLMHVRIAVIIFSWSKRCFLKTITAKASWEWYIELKVHGHVCPFKVLLLFEMLCCHRICQVQNILSSTEAEISETTHNYRGTVILK